MSESTQSHGQSFSVSIPVCAMFSTFGYEKLFVNQVVFCLEKNSVKGLL